MATPIGNLQDISLRAIEILSTVDLIAAEDTRRTAVLLNAHGIKTPLTAYHEHNENSKAVSLLAKLKAGQSIALVSDAGTPLISDPGYRLVHMAAEESIDCSPVPGPCAAIAALSVSGQSTIHFHFEGFLPAKRSARDKRLQELEDKTETLIFYESGHRLLACLKSMAEILGADRELTVCRELTKQFETLLRGNVEKIIQMVEGDSMQKKGEFVLVAAGKTGGGEQSAVSTEARKIFNLLCEELPASKAARITATITGGSRKEIYALRGLD